MKKKLRSKSFEKMSLKVWLTDREKGGRTGDDGEINGYTPNTTYMAGHKNQLKITWTYTILRFSLPLLMTKRMSENL